MDCHVVTFLVHEPTWSHQTKTRFHYIDGLAQDCSNSSALAMELLQYCTKPSICGNKLNAKVLFQYRCLTRSRDTWWRHQMETFSTLLPICAGNSPVPVNSPHKGQLGGALMFALICAWINGWVNNGEAGDLRHNRVHYDGNVMNHHKKEDENLFEMRIPWRCKDMERIST